MKKNRILIFFLMSGIFAHNFSCEDHKIKDLDKGRKWKISEKSIFSCRDGVIIVSIVDRLTPIKIEKNNSSLYILSGNGEIEYYNRIENQDEIISK